jgi:hypothetical protein
MIMGPTVIITLSTIGEPSCLGGLRRKEDNTWDPPSTMTDFKPSLVKTPGTVSGATRPISSAHPDLGDKTYLHYPVGLVSPLLQLVQLQRYAPYQLDPHK